MKTMILLLSLLSINANAQLDTEMRTAIRKAAKQFHVPERELIKIAFVESTFRKSPPMRRNTNGMYDAGKFQINSSHWNTECKSIDVSTLEGNAKCAAKLLSQHSKHSKTDVNWVARYHSKTPQHKTIYAEKLNQAETYLVENNTLLTSNP